MRACPAILLLVALLWAAPAALAQEAASESQPAVEGGSPPAPRADRPRPKTLDDLLELVSQGFELERAENTRRIEEFRQNREKQEQLLNQALETLASKEATSQKLELQYNENESAIGTAQYPSDEHAFLVQLFFALVLGGLAFWLFRRRDVTGPSG